MPCVHNPAGDVASVGGCVQCRDSTYTDAAGLPACKRCTGGNVTISAKDYMRLLDAPAPLGLSTSLTGVCAQRQLSAGLHGGHGFQACGHQ